MHGELSVEAIKPALKAIEIALALKQEIQAQHLILDRGERKMVPQQQQFLQQCLAVSDREWEAISTLRTMRLIPADSTTDNLLPKRNRQVAKTPISLDEAVSGESIVRNSNSSESPGRIPVVRSLVVEYLQDKPQGAKVDDIVEFLFQRRGVRFRQQNLYNLFRTRQDLFRKITPGVYGLVAD